MKKKTGFYIAILLIIGASSSSQAFDWRNYWNQGRNYWNQARDYMSGFGSNLYRRAALMNPLRRTQTQKGYPSNIKIDPTTYTTMLRYGLTPQHARSEFEKEIAKVKDQYARATRGRLLDMQTHLIAEAAAAAKNDHKEAKRHRDIVNNLHEGIISMNEPLLPTLHNRMQLFNQDLQTQKPVFDHLADPTQMGQTP